MVKKDIIVPLRWLAMILSIPFLAGAYAIFMFFYDATKEHPIQPPLPDEELIDIFQMHRSDLEQVSQAVVHKSDLKKRTFHAGEPGFSSDQNSFAYVRTSVPAVAVPLSRLEQAGMHRFYIGQDKLFGFNPEKFAHVKIYYESLVYSDDLDRDFPNVERILVPDAASYIQNRSIEAGTLVFRLIQGHWYIMIESPSNEPTFMGLPM